MKLADVVTQLQLVLPKYTDYFDDSLSISSIEATADTATIITSSAHLLSNNDAVTIADVAIQTAIDAGLTRLDKPKRVFYW